MALRATVFKATVQVADIDHHHYADHALTLARHPSETDERMMVRLVALALNAHELQSRCGGDGTLAFGAGLSDPDDPDLHLTDFTGAKRLWVEVGQPDERAIAKACRQADAVRVYAYSPTAELWWAGVKNGLARLANLEVFRLQAAATQELAALAERSMLWQATVQEGALTLSGERGNVTLEPMRLK
jgi:uncharacterized protein YaeQ